MKQIKWLILIAILLASAYGLYIGMTTPGLKPVVISVYSPPMIEAVEVSHELGDIPTDSEATHVFKLYNMGGKPLVIKDVDAPCGCTVGRVSDNVVAPGDFTNLEVRLDTSIKLGRVKKKISVFTNDPEQPVQELFLTGNVISNMKGHEKIAVKDPLVLFKGKCAECHVEKGRGKAGQLLFQGDCAMCHGQNGQGAVAKNLLQGDFNDSAHVAYLRQVLAEGSPNTPTMPPFSQAKGGPLNEAEMDSLINFLRYKSSLYHEGLLDENGELK